MSRSRQARPTAWRDRAMGQWARGGRTGGRPGHLVDLGTLIPLFPVTTNAAGAWVSGLIIPSDHNLVGIQAALQVALFNTYGPFGFDLSNGVIVTIGY